MKRRSFLKTSSTASLPLMLNGMGVQAVMNSSIFNFINGDSDRVLVLIQLNGGNDGLAMLAPMDQYDNLANVRSNIIIPENEYLKIDHDLAFHPAMTGIKEVYDQGKMNILQSVGYPNQNRSHFRSTDIWTTASAADEFLTTGWLGRYFQDQYPDYPDAYPNADCPDPFALTIGSVVSETCQGVTGNFSLAINDPGNLSPLTEGVEATLPNNCYGNELKFLIQSVKQINAYSDSITDAADKGNNLSTKYGDDNALAQKLKTVAQLISGGLQTKIYIVNIGGFDTHATQVFNGSPTTGRHADLLLQLSDAVCAFQEDLEMLGIEKRVVGMTFSEFGRRIRSNDSFGTDHGTAAPLLVFGSCVNPDVIGDNPEIDQQVSIQDGIPMQIDFRSIYGSILVDWFDVPEDKVRELLYEEFQHLPILKDCSISTNNNEILKDDFNVVLKPNPFSHFVRLSFNSGNERVTVKIFDGLGQVVRNVSSKKYSEGYHELLIETHDLPSGNYFVRVQTQFQQRTVKMVKQ